MKIQTSNTNETSTLISRLEGDEPTGYGILGNARQAADAEAETDSPKDEAASTSPDPNGDPGEAAEDVDAGERLVLFVLVFGQF